MQVLEAWRKSACGKADRAEGEHTLMPVSPNILDVGGEGLSQSGGAGRELQEDAEKMEDDVEADRVGPMDGTVGDDEEAKEEGSSEGRVAMGRK